ncbi:MAG: N-6 DNA methylase, partial [Candidatus Desantisbacteria bacterium]
MKEKIDSIKKTVQIFDSIDYERYSEGRAKSYPEYIQGSWPDELTLISPIFFPKFATEVLGFTLEKTLWPQKSEATTSKRPDFIPTDTKTHPFVFDVKGSDCQDLSKHYDQIKGYIQRNDLIYGILTNIRDLDVYTLENKIEVEKYNFNFAKLYRDYKQNPKECLNEKNTKSFLDFIEDFSYTPLTKEEKIERIANAKPWSGIEELNPNALTDRLRHIVSILHNDVKQQRSKLLSMAEVGRVSAESVADEIEEIWAHISGREIEKVSAETFDKIMGAEEGTLYGRARDAFFRRVAYFAMTRLLLTRVWEDIGFIDQSLYNGGFAKLYFNLNQAISDVLAHAFRLASKHYPWLFNINNNYSWYEPSDEPLIDSLYELSNFYLGRLSQDILGTIYEEYIERVDKKNKGQYYTPREIVNFIWDRVGYTNPQAFFWHTEGRRRPNLIFDPATGSGGFLVEAARRMRECPGFNWDDPQDLRDIHDAILWGIFGSEISLFPYYLTQVNLLIQLTPVIRKILKLT